jgi:CO/xanthine dehydrogenase FAD-binding subunit
MRTVRNNRGFGSGGAALEGDPRCPAILGTSEQRIATTLSDVTVALNPVVCANGPGDQRAIPVDAFVLRPAGTSHREHPLERDDLIEVPAFLLAHTTCAFTSGMKSPWSRRPPKDVPLVRHAVPTRKKTTMTTAMTDVAIRPFRVEVPQAVQGFDGR